MTHRHNGLTSCVTNNCLYVSDYDKNTVYKVDLKSSDNKNKVIKWKVGECPRGLSINSECNLIVACGAVRGVKLVRYKNTTQQVGHWSVKLVSS
jgi:sugar lactone lactonase YvrE